MGLFDKLLAKSTTHKTGQGRKAPKGVAYIEWSCLCDDSSCDECKSLEGTCWIPEVADICEPPLALCKSPEGCRCVGAYVMSEESGAKDTTKFIRTLGGKVTAAQMARYREAKEAPILQREEE